MWTASIEAGLPATGEPTIHFHSGTPSPWSEGVVVRFRRGDDRTWVANVQPGYGVETAVWSWPSANAFIVCARGDAFLVNAEAPADWRFLTHLVTGHVIHDDAGVCLLTTYTDVVAVGPSGGRQWSTRVAIDGVEINNVVAGVIHGRACLDPPDDWRPFRLSLADGRDA